MTKEQALNGLYSELITRHALNEREFHMTVLNLAVKYVNSERAGTLIRYTRQKYSHMMVGISSYLYKLSSEGKTGTYGYKQQISHYLEFLRVINTKMTKEIESGEYVEDDSRLPKMPVEEDISKMGDAIGTLPNMLFINTPKSKVVMEELKMLQGNDQE